MIHVIAEIELEPGKRETFLEAFHSILRTVRSEHGNMEYSATVDLETAIDRQAPLRPDTVTVVEKWEDVAALEAHLAAPHMLAYRQRVREYVRGVTLRVLEPA